MDGKQNKTKIYETIYETLYSELKYHYDDSIYTTHYSNFLPNTLVKWKVKFNSVLDIGCSHGEGLKILKEKGKEVYGIDISKTAIERAKKKKINCKVCSATDIEYEDNIVDLVISTDVIEHLYPEDIEKVYKEAYRLSKKYICFNISNTPEGNNYMTDLYKRGVSKDIKQLHLTCWTYEKHIDFIKKLNLNWKIIETCEKNRYDNTIILLEKQNDYIPSGTPISWDLNYMDYDLVYVNMNEKQKRGLESSKKIKNEIYEWNKPGMSKGEVRLKVSLQKIQNIHNNYLRK